MIPTHLLFCLAIYHKNKKITDETSFPAAIAYLTLLDIPGSSAYSTFSSRMIKSLMKIIISRLESRLHEKKEKGGGGRKKRRSNSSDEESQEEEESDEEEEEEETRGRRRNQRRWGRRGAVRVCREAAGLDQKSYLLLTFIVFMGTFWYVYAQGEPSC